MKGRRFKFSVLLVLTLALFAWRAEAASNAKPFDDEAFLKLCRTGAAWEVEDAIKAGAKVKARDSEHGMTALIWAAQNNPNPDVITALVNNGADVNTKSSIGSTALMYAALNNNNQVITALVKAGADVNAINGNTALMLAAKFNNPDVVATLLKNGADVNARSLGSASGGVDGETALTGAATYNPNLEVITALIKSGADVNARDSDYGMTALMWAAAENGNPDVITTLLENGADAKITDNEGKMAIDYARNNRRIVNTNAFRKLNELSPATTARQSATIKGNSVRIRSEPDTSDADNILYRADNGLIVVVIDKRQANPDELWYFIEYQPGSFGWVRSDLLTLE